MFQSQRNVNIIRLRGSSDAAVVQAKDRIRVPLYAEFLPGFCVSIFSSELRFTTLCTNRTTSLLKFYLQDNVTFQKLLLSIFLTGHLSSSGSPYQWLM